MKHLIMVGTCYLDTVLSVPYFPGEDAKLRATKLDQRRGGNCPNSLEVLQQLIKPENALKLHLISVLPSKESLDTRQVWDSFAEEAVDFQHCIYRGDHSRAASSYIMRSAETGSRTVVSHNDLPDMTVEEFESRVRSFGAEDETWWHFEGRVPETTLECIQLLQKILPKAKISVEIEKPGRDGLLALAAQADVVFFSRAWAEERGHASAEACLRNEMPKKASLALCTWGSDGAAALSQLSALDTWGPATAVEKCEGNCVLCHVKPTRKIVAPDSVGAGDTFIAGMLFGLLCHFGDGDDRERLELAVKLAWLKVQREGFGRLGVDMRECSS